MALAAVLLHVDHDFIAARNTLMLLCRHLAYLPRPCNFRREVKKYVFFPPFHVPNPWGAP